MQGIKTRLDALNERNKTITFQFQLSNFLNQLESFENERSKTVVFFVTFTIFKIKSNLAVTEHRLLKSFDVIVKERSKMEIFRKERKK